MTCPGTFLRDYGYVYLKVNCMGLEVNTKSVAPTFPLFFHERLRFERVSFSFVTCFVYWFSSRSDDRVDFSLVIVPCFLFLGIQKLSGPSIRNSSLKR